MLNLIASSTYCFPKESERKNQDHILPPQQYHNGYLFAVADGVGGYKGGEIASQIAIQNLMRDPQNVFTQSLAEIKKLSEEYHRASTTLTFAYLTEEGLHIGHIHQARQQITSKNQRSHYTSKIT